MLLKRAVMSNLDDQSLTTANFSYLFFVCLNVFSWNSGKL